MKYFLHDTNSFDDEKITELYLRFGYEGLGLFYTALEKMAKQEKPMKTEILKAQLRVGKRLEKCWSFMEKIGIISSNNGETFNKQLLNFSEKYQIKKEKTREKVSQWRKKQEDIETVTGYVPISNPPKVKKSKVKVIEEKIYKYNEFYDTQLEVCEDLQYIAFVKFLFGDNGTDRPFTKVLKMKDQIGYSQFKKLRVVAEENGTKIYDKVRAIENDAKHKYESFYLTLNNWLKSKTPAYAS